MTPKNWWEFPKTETQLDIVPTEREEREKSPTRAHDEFWVWNTDPSKVPAKHEKPS